MFSTGGLNIVYTTFLVVKYAARSGEFCKVIYSIIQFFRVLMYWKILDKSARRRRNVHYLRVLRATPSTIGHVNHGYARSILVCIGGWQPPGCRRPLYWNRWASMFDMVHVLRERYHLLFTWSMQGFLRARFTPHVESQLYFLVRKYHCLLTFSWLV